MKNFRIVIFTVLCIFLSAAFAQGQGGLDFDRHKVSNNLIETTAFIEDSVFQFKIEIPYDTLNSLRDSFLYDRDTLKKSKLQGAKIAGFCFVPLMDTVTNSAIPNAPSSFKFYSKGFRAILTLYKLKNNQPSEVSFYTYKSIPKALATYKPSTGPLKHKIIDFSKDIDYSASEIEVHSLKFEPSSDQVVFNTREFDLVFLDNAQFDTLAISLKYFTNNDRVGKGITLERAFNTINVEDAYTQSLSTYAMIAYRSLVFRPLPTPLLQAYDSEAAIAYTNGNECPPWWREPGGDVEASLFRMIQDEYFDNTEEDNWPWDEEWFQWLIRFFGLGAAIYMANKGFNNFNKN